MSKQFWAINRVTGEKWKPDKGKKQFLVMYDSGYLAKVTEDFYTYMEPLDVHVWQRVIKGDRYDD